MIIISEEEDCSTGLFFSSALAASLAVNTQKNNHDGLKSKEWIEIAGFMKLNGWWRHDRDTPGFCRGEYVFNHIKKWPLSYLRTFNGVIQVALDQADQRRVFGIASVVIAVVTGTVHGGDVGAVLQQNLHDVLTAEFTSQH